MGSGVRSGPVRTAAASVRAPPTTWTILRHDGPDHLGVVEQCAPCASNGPNRLGLCALQGRAAGGTRTAPHTHAAHTTRTHNSAQHTHDTHTQHAYTQHTQEHTTHTHSTATQVLLWPAVLGARPARRVGESFEPGGCTTSLVVPIAACRSTRRAVRLRDDRLRSVRVHPAAAGRGRRVVAAAVGESAAMLLTPPLHRC